jgi:hypothetical protein
VAVVSGARRRFHWQLDDMCDTFIFDEATRAGSYGVRALCLSLRGFDVLVVSYSYMHWSMQKLRY